MAGRSSHARAILGPALYDQMASAKILLVGAGGIGCELIKNVVLTGFGDITLLDLDTIDLSNLNRQFLFRKKDVKQSKALTAAATVSPFNPNVHIRPIHGNIKEEQFDVVWFSQFDIVLNALDNLDARLHVNKMCMAAGVPLVESGTAGYLGQVQPILKDASECFSCNTHDTPKSFPVCTIRSTPSQPIHCIVWAKSYLMSQLFAEDEDASGSDELDEALKNGQNEKEVATLKAEAQAFAKVRQLLRQPSNDGGETAARLVFDKIFNNDIRNLLIMEDMWRARAPPTPLDWDAIFNGSLQLPASSAPPTQASTSASTNGDASQLKDQKSLTLKENLELFIDSTKRLSARLQSMISSSSSSSTTPSSEPTISFDKDDPDTLDFVTAASNLRSAAYSIQTKTKWEVKEMAGNIIPAIATTNAIVAGMIVLQALHMLAGRLRARASAAGQQDLSKKIETGPFDGSTMRLVNVVASKPNEPFCAYKTSNPKSGCGVCRDTYATLKCDTGRTLLGDVVKGILGVDEPEVAIFEGNRLLYDLDMPENLDKTLEDLGVARGKFLTIVDEEDPDEEGFVKGTIQLAVAALPTNSKDPWILPTPQPNPPRYKKPSTMPPREETASPVKIVRKGSKRLLDDLDDDDDIQIGQGGREAKRAKLNLGNVSGASASPKKKAFEDDGLVILDEMGENVDVEMRGIEQGETAKSGGFADGREVIEID
ncbi:hypothetical protein DL96DRAFT_1625225 [Flagelloscypha sp. PMI_526]|nr:hypothetical protein DL96DRAFT_1625225 [Flagelloscypha sp. PMI_526]